MVRGILKGEGIDMKVTIDGITYEGSPSEIRDIIENPPRRVRTVNYPSPSEDWVDDWNDNFNRHTTWWDAPGIQRNWDGSPRITCEI